MRSISFAILISLLMCFCGQMYADNHETDSLLNELKRPLSDTVRIKTLIKLFNSGKNEMSYDSAVMIYNEAISLAKKNNSDSLYVQIIQSVYNWHLFEKGDKTTAITLGHTLLEHMQQRNYITGMASACKFLGVSYLYNSLDSSMYYHTKCIDLFNKAGNLKGVNAAKINLGAIYYQLKRYKDCIEVSLQAMYYFEKQGDMGRAGTCAVNIGECYRELGDYNNAVSFFRRYEKDKDSKINPYGVAHVHCLVAGVYTLQKKYSEADVEYEKSLKIGNEFNRDDIIFMSYSGLADLKLAARKWTDAIDNCKLAEKHLVNSNANKMMLYNQFYKAYLGIGNYKDALNNYRLFVEIRDSLQSAEKEKSISELEAVYQNKEKQAQITLLSKESEIQSKKMEQQTLIRNATIAISILIIAFGFVLFNRFKLKKKIENQQAIINERKRISHELHDDLGAQLSTARMFLNSLKNNSDSDKNKSLVDNSIQLIDGSINDLRKIMDDLQVSTLQDKGYIFATEELVNKINQLQQIKFTLSHHGLEKRLEQKTEHNLFRITQELINNTIKYARAKNVSIDLIKRDEKIVLMYEDDGIGFDLQNASQGYGLSNIESRTKSLGGEVHFDTSPGTGFRATVETLLIYA